MIDTEEEYENSVRKLVDAIKDAMVERNKEEKKDTSERPTLKRSKSSFRVQFNTKAQRKSEFIEKMEKANENLSEDRMLKFWQRNFKNDTVIEWDR